MKLKYGVVILAVFCCQINLTYSQPLWHEANTNSTVNLNCAAVPRSPSQMPIFACGDSGTVLRSSDWGANWTSVSGNGLPQNITLNTIACSNYPTSVIVAGNIGANTYVYQSTNSGTNWSLVFTQTGGRIDYMGYSPNYYSPKVFIIGEPVGGRWSIWKSTNLGLNWDSANIRLFQSGAEHGYINAANYDVNGAFIYIGTNNNRLYFSPDTGVTWNARTITETNIYSVCSYYGNVYAAGSNYLSSTNSGNNWIQTSLPGTGDFRSIANIMGSSSIGCYTRASGPLYYTTTGGSNWITYTQPSGNYNMITSMFTWGEGAFPQIAVRNNGGISYRIYYLGAVKRISDIIPDNFKLSQNYPNPFNPVTVIRFQVAGYRFVKLTVYDVMGREVAELVNQQLQPGSYSVDWDASNYPSGVYLYKLETGIFVQSKKMVLVK